MRSQVVMRLPDQDCGIDTFGYLVKNAYPWSRGARPPQIGVHYFCPPHRFALTDAAQDLVKMLGIAFWRRGLYKWCRSRRYLIAVEENWK